MWIKYAQKTNFCISEGIYIPSLTTACLGVRWDINPKNNYLNQTAAILKFTNRFFFVCLKSCLCLKVYLSEMFKKIVTTRAV